MTFGCLAVKEAKNSGDYFKGFYCKVISAKVVQMCCYKYLFLQFNSNITVLSIRFLSLFSSACTDECLLDFIQIP